MKSQVLQTVWCDISGEAAGEISSWSLLGVKIIINLCGMNPSAVPSQVRSQAPFRYCFGPRSLLVMYWPLVCARYYLYSSTGPGTNPGSHCAHLTRNFRLYQDWAAHRSDQLCAVCLRKGVSDSLPFHVGWIIPPTWLSQGCIGRYEHQRNMLFVLTIARKTTTPLSTMTLQHAMQNCISHHTSSCSCVLSTGSCSSHALASVGELNSISV